MLQEPVLCIYARRFANDLPCIDGKILRIHQVPWPRKARNIHSRATRFRGNAAHCGGTEKSCCCTTVAAWFQASCCTLTWVVLTCQTCGLKKSQDLWSFHVLSRVLKCRLQGAQYLYVVQCRTNMYKWHRITSVTLCSCHQGLVGSNFQWKVVAVISSGVHQLWNVYRLVSKHSALAGTLCCDARGSGCGFRGWAHRSIHILVYTHYINTYI